MHTRLLAGIIAPFAKAILVLSKRYFLMMQSTLKKLIDLYDAELARTSWGGTWGPWTARWFVSEPVAIIKLRALYALFPKGENKPLNHFRSMQFYVSCFFQVDPNISKSSTIYKVFYQELFKLENEEARRLREKIKNLKTKNCFIADKYFVEEKPTLDITTFFENMPEEFLTPDNVKQFENYLEENNNYSIYWYTHLALNFRHLHTPENIRAIYTEPELQSFLALSTLPPAQRTQVNFDAYKPHADVLCYCVQLIKKLPEHIFTQAHFDRIIAICVAAGEDHYKAIQDIQTYIDVALAPVANQRHFVFNPAQSTHTESVHESASKSARKLYDTYKYKIDSHKKFTLVISQLNAWASQLSPERFIKEDARYANYIAPARRAITRLLQPGWTHEDPVSGITVRQLMAMVWLGTHDLSKLPQAPPKMDALEKQNFNQEILCNAEKAMLEGFYDIQRGYNNNDTFSDNGAAHDISICPPGNFNKLVQILRFCQHADVEIIYYTFDTARDKLQALIRTETLEYLFSLHKKSKTSDNAAQQLQALCTNIREDYFIPTALWNTLKQKITSHLIDEFPLLFRRGERDPILIRLLNTVPAIDVSSTLLKFEKQIEPAPEVKSEVYHSPGLR
jgi:hypothetical protein